MQSLKEFSGKMERRVRGETETGGGEEKRAGRMGRRRKGREDRQKEIQWKWKRREN